MRKTRSIYCSDDEYKRLKIALRLMRVFDALVFDALSVDDFPDEQQSKYFLEIMKGDNEE